MLPKSNANRSRALVLVGHGSHLHAASSAPVYAHAKRIRASGLFDEVLETFWKEEPALGDALALVESDDVYVVPLFLAEGYFTRQVVPRELGIDRADTTCGTRRIRYCRPFGAHPAIAELVLARARAILQEHSLDARDSALVIIGHGTGRSRTSGDTVYRLLESLRAKHEFGSVDCGFLDEAPAIGDVVEAVDLANVVLVPFFLAEGWHTGSTIPEDLGLAGTRTDRDGRTVWYTPPVGTLPEVSDLVLRIVAEAQFDEAALPVPDSDGIEGVIAFQPPPITNIRRRFLDWIDEAEGADRIVLEIVVRRTSVGTYCISHVDDRATPPDRLSRSSDPEEALAISRTDARGRYRPLRTAESLISGWLIENLGSEGLWRAISLLYPAAVLHGDRWGNGDFRTIDYETWAARQTGMYDRLGEISDESLLATIDECCESCLRHRAWRSSLEGGHPDDRAPTPGLAIVPCREPCTFFGMRARKRLGPGGGGKEVA